MSFFGFYGGNTLSGPFVQLRVDREANGFNTNLKDMAKEQETKQRNDPQITEVVQTMRLVAC